MWARADFYFFPPFVFFYSPGKEGGFFIKARSTL